MAGLSVMGEVACLHCGEQTHNDWVSSNIINGVDPSASTQRKMPIVLVE